MPLSKYFSYIVGVSFIGGGNQSTGENHRLVTSHWQTWLHNVVSRIILNGWTDTDYRYINKPTTNILHLSLLIDQLWNEMRKKKHYRTVWYPNHKIIKTETKSMIPVTYILVRYIHDHSLSWERSNISVLYFKWNRVSDCCLTPTD